MRKISFFVFALVLLVYACGESSKTPNNQGDIPTDINLGNKGAPDGKDVQITDADKEMALSDSNYLVPSPGEVLDALNRLEDIEWSTIMDYNEQTNYSDKASRALNLGIRIADSFVAINDKDKDNFGKMSAAIFELGDALNVGSILTDKRDDLEELSGKGEWNKMGVSINGIHNDIQMAIEDAGEDDLVSLASIGGWIEGLRIVSSHIATNYSADNAGLLNQVDLIKYYQRKIALVKNDSKVVKEVKEGLDKIVTILEKTNSDKALSQGDVKTLQTISQGLIDAITQS
jgi:soluble cytochrome b562